MAGSDFAFGDTVRVRDTSVTMLAGLAGLVGTVRGETKPSVSRVDIIGDLANDRAVDVYFADRNRDYWLEPSLLAFVDQDKGQLIAIAGRSTERGQTGHRISPAGAETASERPWWKFW